jgi:glycosyltransferase involved in cell wall biosynthesis
MMTKKFKYSILIPALDAEKYLPSLLSQIRQTEHQPVEIVVVNDGSTDKTEQIASSFGAVVLSHSSNKGKGAALRTGFRYFLETSQNDYVLCIDADLQHHVAEIPKFLSYAGKNDLKFVIGNRLNQMHTMPLHRKISNKTTSFILTKLTGQQIKDSQCGYRLVHRDVLNTLQLEENGFQMESEMILRAAAKNYKIGFVDIRTVYNDESSQIRNLSDTLKFISLVLRELIERVPWFIKKN